MELRRTEQGFALYKEKDCIGTCAVRPAAQGADITALCIAPQWRRRGYGSYLLKEVLRTFAGYDREKVGERRIGRLLRFSRKQVVLFAAVRGR